MESVRPIAPARPLPVATAAPPIAGGVTKLKAPRGPVAAAQPERAGPMRTAPGITLDAGWDRRLSRGLVSPDRTVDLHGHGLQSAYVLLDQALGQAIAQGARVVLLVTGKPPVKESERPHARGAIRAAVGDWLAGSRHADRIAAIRGAHPRHGGAGALYIVLRRPR